MKKRVKEKYKFSHSEFKVLMREIRKAEKQFILTTYHTLSGENTSKQNLEDAIVNLSHSLHLAHSELQQLRSSLK